MQVYIKKISNYNFTKIYGFLQETFNKAELWEKLKNCKTVLLKPNLLAAFIPEKAVTTHPVIIDAVATILKENNKEVWLGDSPGGSVSLERVLTKTGLKPVIEKHQIKTVNFNQGKIRNVKSEGINLHLTENLYKADAIINLPKYKTHSLMYFTGCIKNLYGLIPGLKKSDYHREYPDVSDFAKVLFGLYQEAKQYITFNIMDGIYGMEGEGPSSGEVRNFGIIFGSYSASALDYAAAQMMSFSNNQIDYIVKSLQSDGLIPSKILLPESWQNFKFQNVKIKKISLLIKFLSTSPDFLKKIFRKLYRYYPDFNNNCRRCNICVEGCPVKAITLTKNMKHPEIDYDKCIKCLCCHEFCPHDAIYINKSLLAKFLIK